MREIKFLFWHKNLKRMSKPYGLGVIWEHLTEEWGNFSWDDVEKRQYTGLKDKNGKEIYEGDIVRFDEVMTADDTLGVAPNGYIYIDIHHSVVWNDELVGWDLNFTEDDELKYKRDTRGLLIEGVNTEVIGNIYESPELLSDS